MTTQPDPVHVAPSVTPTEALAAALHATATMSHRTRYPSPGDSDARGTCLCRRDAEDVLSALSGWSLVRTEGLEDGVSLIAAERRRQQEPTEHGGEGYNAMHDRDHGDELARAAATYATPANRRVTEDRNGYAGGRRAVFADVPVSWPWDGRYWKPTPDDRIRELVKAGALIAAAIDSAVHP